MVERTDEVECGLLVHAVPSKNRAIFGAHDIVAKHSVNRDLTRKLSLFVDLLFATT